MIYMQSGDVVDGRYRVQEALPRRAIGDAWRVVDLRDQRPLDLVRLPAGSVKPRQLAERVLRLAPLPSGLLARPLEAVALPGDHGGLVLEPAHGRTLSDRLRAGAMGVGEVLRVLDGVLAGLSALHAHGVWHRDLRPENVRLVDAPGGAPPWVVLHGAGIAWLLADGSAPSVGGVLYGHPQFTAPEQWVNRAADARTDVYATGLLGYLMLLGRNLVTSGAPIDACRQHGAAPRPMPVTSAAGEAVPRALAEALRTACEPGPARRHTGAEAMRTALVSARGLIPPTAARLNPVEIDATSLVDLSLNMTLDGLDALVAELDGDEDTLLDAFPDATLAD